MAMSTLQASVELRPTDMPAYFKVDYNYEDGSSADGVNNVEKIGIVYDNILNGATDTALVANDLLSFGVSLFENEVLDGDLNYAYVDYPALLFQK